MDFNAGQNIDIMFEKFEKFLKEKTVIGEPIVMGKVTLIPALTVSFGMGNGGGDGSDANGGKGIGSGGGIGAKISPTALIVVKNDEVEILPISKGHSFEKIVDLVPDLVDKMKDMQKEN
ncbi:spore germination protein GerW family protein [Eubacteriaceae bacterium ES2]|nr:spore germination protein GerW family protein [Eubacteriaceae bacterium ES2]